MSDTTSQYPKLRSREDWYLWISSITSLGLNYNVWNYIDPEGIDEIPSPITEEITRTGLRKVNERIDMTVHQPLQVIYLDVHDPRGKLQALKASLQPTTQDQKDHLREAYEQQKLGPKRAGIDTWLNEWIVIVVRARKLTIDNLSEHQICEGFIESSKEVNPTFFSQMKGRRIKNNENSDLRQAITLLATRIPRIGRSSATVGGSSEASNQLLEVILDRLNDSNRDDLDIHDCIRNFRETMSKNTLKRGTHAAFGATLGNEQLPTQDHEATRQKTTSTISESSRSQPDRSKRRKCICGLEHPYTKCWYLNPDDAYGKWKPRETVQAKVLSIVKGDRKTQDKIANIFRKQNIALPLWWPGNSATTSQNKDRTSESTEHSVNALHAVYAVDTEIKPRHNLFKLDSAATVHVSGEFNRFENFRPTEQPIKHGDTESMILGYGSVTIEVTTPYGTKSIQISEVAYVPGFHFNILSTAALQEKGLYFNPLLGWMTDASSKRLYKVTLAKRLYTIEKAHPGAVAFATVPTEE